jgi:hypothetical protein
MYSHTEFEVAIRKTREAHPTVSYALGETVMKKFVERWESNRAKAKWEQVNFGELIRLTLNELKISPKSNRQMYSALIGHYYTRHATYANRRKAQAPKKKRAPSPIAVVFADNGQAAWQL